MARSAEAGCRQGFQQGLAAVESRFEAIRADLDEWRYRTPIDDAPWPNAPCIGLSVVRLFSDYPRLLRLGFVVSIDRAAAPEMRADYGYRPRRK